jgi:hypothetical protein
MRRLIIAAALCMPLAALAQNTPAEYLEQQLLRLPREVGPSAYHRKPKRIFKMIFIVSSHLTPP